MSVKIRLKQTGKLNARKFRIVVVDESKKRDGAVIEELGSIVDQKLPESLKVNREKVDYWLKLGAQPSDSVRKLLKLT